MIYELLKDRIMNGSGSEAIIKSLAISANGTYNAPEGVDGYNPITVAVPERVPVVESKEITKNGTYTPAEGVDGFNSVVVNVPQGGGLPEEALLITGDCGNRFNNDYWNWYIEGYGSQITTQNITNCSNMFRNNQKLTSIPFDINCDNSDVVDFQHMFNGSYKITNIGKIINAYPKNMESMFYSATNLRYLPEFVNPNFDRIHNGERICNMFQFCHSLRQIPEDFLKELWGTTTDSYNTIFNRSFQYCYNLDEIRGLNPQTGNITSDMFTYAFDDCSRVKDILFATQNDGTPYTVNWSNQTINLGNAAIGYAIYKDNIIATYRNSGITADKEVTDNVTYQALKNDPDWFTTSPFYSRYNHDSAVNTINSLPDTSAFLATNGGTNTIIFRANNGRDTDGGAINTLTEEEIAVATAKGWTVSLF